MQEFAPYVFILLGIVISYTLYKYFSDSDLRIFLLTNSIVQFIIATYSQNTVCVIVAILSLVAVVLTSRKPPAGGETDE